MPRGSFASPPRLVLRIDPPQPAKASAVEIVQETYRGTTLEEVNLVAGHPELPGVRRGTFVASPRNPTPNRVVAVCPGDGRRANVAVVVSDEKEVRCSMTLPFFLENGYHVVAAPEAR